MIRAHASAALLVIFLLAAPLSAKAGPTDAFVAAISPGAVKPLAATGTYTITITSQPGSAAATQAHIAIPAGFFLDGVLSPPQASIVSGPCAPAAWNASLGVTSIDLSAPDGSAALCAQGTLAVTFSVLAAPGADGAYPWTTNLSGSDTAFDPQSPTLYVDSTSPETAISGQPPAATAAIAGFGFSGDDGSGAGVARFECDLDDGGFQTCTSPAGYSGLPSGGHTFEVRAVDAAGNVDPTPASFTWTVDADAPQTAIQAGPPKPSPVNSATFSFAGDDGAGTGIARFECDLDDGGFATCTSGTTYNGLSDGSHTFRVRAVDAVGNVDPTPDSYIWVIDATPPPAPVLLSAPQTPSGSSDATFTFSEADPDASLLCKLDAGDFSDCSSGSASYSGLADGEHSFGVKAVDPIGHQSDVTSYAWTIDTVHPLVTLTDKPPLLTNRTSASFSFTSNKAGSTYQCELDGGGFTSCASPKLYNGLGDGSHTFGVRGVSFGNVGLTSEYTWTIDTVAPETAISSTPPATSSSSSATFAFTSTEPDSTFTCGLDAAGFTPCTTPHTYSGLGDGAHAFRVEAIDRAGNVDASPASYSWQIVGIGPEAIDHTPPGNVRRLRRNVGYGLLRLGWKPPAAADFDHVSVFVSTSAKSPPRTRVYTGKSAQYTNKRFKNGLYYRYLVVSYDHAANASRGAASVIPPSVLLRSPRDGRIVHSPPRLLWMRVPGATFYNVQLYQGAQKILSAWPNRERLALTTRWTYAGRRFGLRTGLYRWYVWPAFGPRAASRYGQLLGQGTFRFR